jgi:hypothetical protein
MKKKPPVTQHIVNVGVSALAREIGQSPATVSKKLKNGQTPEQIRQAAAQKAGRAPTNRKGMGTPPTATEYDLVVQGRERLSAMDEMKFRRAKALAERQEIENMLKRGELLPVAYVRKWATRYLTDGRDMMLAGPSELQDVLAAETDPMKVNAILRLWLERVMGKFEQLRTLWGADSEEKVA